MPSEIRYDYIVIGGGSAGCVVAARLAEERLGSVLLLEAGQSARENPEVLSADGFKEAFANDRTMWDRMTASQSQTGNHKYYAGTGTGLGGSGSVNGMVYTRGDKRDFEQWPEGWKWQDVVPHFEALEARLGIRHREPTQFTEAGIEAAVETGFTRKNGLNDGDLCGFIGYNDMNYAGDQRRSSYTAMIFEREQELDLLTIHTEAKARKLIFDDQQTVIAVEYSHQGEIKTAEVNKETILCAGALETPKLLMLSGVGPTEELQRFAIPEVLNAPGVGKNLHDHPSVPILYKGKQPIDFKYPQVYGFHRANKKLPLPADQADICLVYLTAGTVLKHTMLRMAAIMLLPEALHKKPFVRKVMRSLVELAFKIPGVARFTSHLYGIVVILGKPVSRGELKLRSTNPEDNAWIDPAYYKDSADMDTMLNAVDMARNIADAPPLKTGWGAKLLTGVVNSASPKKIKKWIERSSITVFHFCGTCSMGTNDEQPVSPDLKVKGLNNVRVADASVINEVPVSALNAPSMMIGYRAVDFIRNDER